MRPAMSGISAYGCDGKTIDGAVATEEQGRLEQGPAKAPESPAAIEEQDWPMYRHDARRRSAGAGELPEQLALSWERKLLPTGNEAAPASDAAASAPASTGILRNDWILNKISGDALNQPVVAEGKVFACLTHAQQVVALDAQSGQVAWRFLAPARVDGSPAIAKGLCLVGCNDGWVYALRADNGEQVWRFRAAPAERRIVAYGQVESRWPVVGGPLVMDDKAYVIAGRTTEADGGLYVHALDVNSGKCLWSARRVKPDDGPIGAWNLRGIKDDYVGPADMLCCDGRTLAISAHRTGRFDLATGKSVSTGAYNAPRLGLMPSRYAADNQKVSYPPLAYSEVGAVVAQQAADAQKKQHTYIALAASSGWKVQVTDGMRVEALAASGGTVLAALSRANSGELWAIGKDGSKLGSYPLSAGPVFEGLAVARGRVFVTLQNGSVACFAGK
jgi:outer membrane protein assembly factor BamB